MRTERHLLFALAIASCAAIGCDKAESGAVHREAAAAEAREQAERQRRLEAERARVQAENHASQERELRLAAEKQASDAATSKWAWIGVAALIGTVTGVAIRKKVTADYIKQSGGS